MLSMKKFLTCFTFLLICASAAMAQGKQAQEADEAFNKGFFYNAIELYKKAYTTEKKASEKAVLIYKVAEAYRALGDAENAEVWYEKANKAQYPDPITYYYIGEALKEQGKYAEAIAAYNKYKEKNPGDARRCAPLCQQAQVLIEDHDTRWTPRCFSTIQYDFSTYSDKRNMWSSRQQTASTGTETDGIVGEALPTCIQQQGQMSEPVRLPPATDART